MGAPLLSACGSTCSIPGLPFGLVNLCVIAAIVFIAVTTLFKYYFARRAASRQDAAPANVITDADVGSERPWK